MNLAWANPLTGVREQTATASMEEMEKEARWRVWNDLQDGRDSDLRCPVFRQEAIGSYSLGAGAYVDPFKVLELDKSDPHYTFAWADPESGARCSDGKFPDLKDTLGRLQEARQPADQVIVYAQWPHMEVRWSDPMPERWEPRVEPPILASSDDEIARRKEDLESVGLYDDAVAKIAGHTAWALLDIAESLRKSRAGDV